MSMIGNSIWQMLEEIAQGKRKKIQMMLFCYIFKLRKQLLFSIFAFGVQNCVLKKTIGLHYFSKHSVVIQCFVSVHGSEDMASHIWCREYRCPS